MAKCKSCGAQIIWARVEKSGKLMPLDSKPEHRAVFTDGTLMQAIEIVPTYLPHWATCPNADTHRKER